MLHNGSGARCPTTRPSRRHRPGWTGGANCAETPGSGSPPTAGPPWPRWPPPSPLRPAPAVPFPATLTATRRVSAQALVSFRGNRYSVPPELAGAKVAVSLRLGSLSIDIATTPPAAAGARGGGVVLARHHLAPTGAGAMIRDHGHVLALDQAAMTAATSAAPHRRKQRLPPSSAARDAALALQAPTGAETTRPGATADPGVVVDLARYAAAAAGRNTLR